MKLLLLFTISLSAFGACGPLAPNPVTGIMDCTGSGGGGGSGTVTSVGLVGTANQITVTGTSPITTSGSWTLSFPAGGVTLPGTTTGTFSGGLTGSASQLGGVAAASYALLASPTFTGTVTVGTTVTLNGTTGVVTGTPFRINASVVDAGLGNTFVGPATGNATTSGDQNTGFGDKVLRSVTTGDHNVGLGPGTLDALTSGNNNVALGHAAAISLITGDDNLFIGNSTAQNATALGVKNVFIGTGVAASVTTGSAVDHTVGIGGDALSNLTTGTFNTSVGGDSGKGVTTGDANVFIGDAADTTNGANSFGIAIGFAAKTNATQAVAIGQGIVNAVANSVNIGTNSKIMLALASAVAVSALPTCDSTYLGAIRSVTDSLSPAWGVTVVGTGAVPAGVRCNGTTWTVYAI